MAVDYKPAELKDYGGDLAREWYITYWVYSITKGKKVRRRCYAMNKFPTKKERYDWSKDFIKAINKQLKEGAVIEDIEEEEDIEVDEQIDLKKATLIQALEWAKKKKFKKKLSDSTKKNYRSHLKALHQWLEKRGQKNILFKEVDTGILQEFFDYLSNEKKREDKTYNNYLTNFTALYTVLMKRTGQLIRNPCLDIERKEYSSGSTHIAYSEEEYKKLVANARKYKKMDLLLFMYFVYYCFMRPSEVFKIKRKHIWLDEGVLQIPGSPNTKIKRKNYRQLSQKLIALIKELKIDRLQDEEYVISNHFSKRKVPVGINWARKQFTSLLKKSELNKEGFTPYGLKHSGNIAMFKKFKDIKKNMLQNGHDNPETTRIYLRDLGIVVDKEVLDF